MRFLNTPYIYCADIIISGGRGWGCTNLAIPKVTQNDVCNFVWQWPEILPPFLVTITVYCSLMWPKD